MHDPATARFNGGKADPLGRFWAGTIYEPRDAAKAKLLSLDGRRPAPVLELKASNAITANGLAWSTDTSTLYWSDTPRHTIRAWDWDATRNVMSRQHEAVARFFERAMVQTLEIALITGHTELKNLHRYAILAIKLDGIGMPILP